LKKFWLFGWYRHQILVWPIAALRTEVSANQKGVFSVTCYAETGFNFQFREQTISIIFSVTPRGELFDPQPHPVGVCSARAWSDPSTGGHRTEKAVASVSRATRAVPPYPSTSRETVLERKYFPLVSDVPLASPGLGLGSLLRGTAH